MATVEATEDVEAITEDLVMEEASMGDSATATAIMHIPISGDMAMAGGVILIGGTTVTIPIIIMPVGAGVLDTGQICPLLGQGFGYPAGGFHATKSGLLLQTEDLISQRC